VQSIEVNYTYSHDYGAIGSAYYKKGLYSNIMYVVKEPGGIRGAERCSGKFAV
jgi:hypothetical protein